MNNTSNTFEQVLDQEKNELTEALILFGEGKRLNKALADLEMNRPEFYKFYEAGASSRQGEVDDLNFQLAEMKSRLNEAYTDGQSSMYKTKQAEIDELNLKINRLIDSEENIARSCEGWRDAHRELDERIIKALSLIKDEVIEVDYDEYRFVGNFVDADKLKEILE